MMTRKELRKNLHDLGIKTFRNKITGSLFIKKAEVKKILAHMVKSGQVIDMQKAKRGLDTKEVLKEYKNTDFAMELAKLKGYDKRGKIGDHEIVFFKLGGYDGVPYYSINFMLDGRQVHMEQRADDRRGWALVSKDENTPKYGNAQEMNYWVKVSDWANLEKAVKKIEDQMW